MRRVRHDLARGTRGFSIVEMLIALLISTTLLAATMQALDASWRGYKHVSESASSHVVARIVIHRALAMVRTGTQFTPVPADVLDAALNPMVADRIEFVAEADRLAGNGRRTRLERRSPTATPGQLELWYVLMDGAAVIDQRPLMRNVRDITFILEYDVGPRLTRATIDMTVWPNDDDALQIDIGDPTVAIRLVASASPRTE
jgi:prepilin-type N-terminal cleavage/methylation domain-containing protein